AQVHVHAPQCHDEYRHVARSDIYSSRQSARAERSPGFRRLLSASSFGLRDSRASGFHVLHAMESALTATYSRHLAASGAAAAVDELVLPTWRRLCRNDGYPGFATRRPCGHTT